MRKADTMNSKNIVFMLIAGMVGSVNSQIVSDDDAGIISILKKKQTVQQASAGRIEEAELNKNIQRLLEKILKEKKLVFKNLAPSHQQEIIKICNRVEALAQQTARKQKTSLPHEALEQALKNALSRIIGIARGSLTKADIDDYVSSSIINHLKKHKLSQDLLDASGKKILESRIKLLQKTLHTKLDASRNDTISLATCNKAICDSIESTITHLEHDLLWSWFCMQATIAKQDPERAKHSAPCQTAASKKRTDELQHILKDRTRIVHI